MTQRSTEIYIFSGYKATDYASRQYFYYLVYLIFITNFRVDLEAWVHNVILDTFAVLSMCIVTNFLINLHVTI